MSILSAARCQKNLLSFSWGRLCEGERHWPSDPTACPKLGYFTRSMVMASSNLVWCPFGASLVWARAFSLRCWMADSPSLKFSLRLNSIRDRKAFAATLGTLLRRTQETGSPGGKRRIRSVRRARTPRNHRRLVRRFRFPHQPTTSRVSAVAGCWLASSLFFVLDTRSPVVV
jgi:hypothetical protein